MLQRGAMVPHFQVTGLDGRDVSYRSISQHQNLVLAVLSTSAEGRAYARTITERLAELAGHNAAVVLTADTLPELPSPTLIIADRWGEIVYIQTATRIEDLAGTDEIAEWLHYIQQRCPECEGEYR